MARFRVTYVIEGTQLVESIPLRRSNILALLRDGVESGDCRITGCLIETLPEAVAQRRSKSICHMIGRNLQYTCTRRATKVVNGKPFCAKHALGEEIMISATSKRRA